MSWRTSVGSRYSSGAFPSPELVVVVGARVVVGADVVVVAPCPASSMRSYAASNSSEELPLQLAAANARARKAAARFITFKLEGVGRHLSGFDAHQKRTLTESTTFPAMYDMGGSQQSESPAGAKAAGYVPLVLLAAVVAFFVGVFNLGENKGIQIGGADGLVYPGWALAVGSVVGAVGCLVLLRFVGSKKWMFGLAIILLGIGIAVGSSATLEDFCGDAYRLGCP